MARTSEAIQADIDSVEAQLTELEGQPLKFTLHGQTIDNTDRYQKLQKRLQDLRAEKGRQSRFQGPDLLV